jgi:hypothetical protein
MSRLKGWSRFAGLLLAVAMPLCAQFVPPSTDVSAYAARVVSITGSVSVLRDNQPWALASGDSIQVKQIVISGPDGHAMFQVSDGSTFEVFPNSYVVFRKNAPNWRDLIDVIVGRVKVHIEHWGNQPNPNRVFTPTAVISVRGTTFDVSVDQESESTTVDVVEGEVSVRHALRWGEKTLHTGETLTVYKTVPLDAHLIDKGTVMQHALRSIVDALQTMATRMPRSSGGGLGGVGGGPGGTSSDPTKPAPPPPPPPPPGPPQ